MFDCVCVCVHFYYGGEHINLAIKVEYQEGDEEKLRENEATDVDVYAARCAIHLFSRTKLFSEEL